MGNIFGLHQPVVDIDRWPDGGGVGKGGVGVSAIEGEKIGQTCIDKTVPFIFFADDLTDIGSTATKDYDTPQGRRGQYRLVRTSSKKTRDWRRHLQAERKGHVAIDKWRGVGRGHFARAEGVDGTVKSRATSMLR
jgi:hypothetical protein